jgi:hypothetical protein
MGLVFNKSVFCFGMEPDEKIVVHLLSVWREEKKLFSRGKECMFFLTDKHVSFIIKTEAKMNWWKAAVQRQIVALSKSPTTMITQDGYGRKELENDLKNEKNEEIPLSNIISVGTEEKRWGTVLNLKFSSDGKEKSYRLSVVRDWIGYPIRDPMKFLTVDWTPIVNYIQDKGAAK